MELYLRIVGKASFRRTFGSRSPEEAEKLAQLPLFELEKEPIPARHLAGVLGSRIAARFSRIGLDDPLPELRDEEPAQVPDASVRSAGSKR